MEISTSFDTLNSNALKERRGTFRSLHERRNSQRPELQRSLTVDDALRREEQLESLRSTLKSMRSQRHPGDSRTSTLRSHSTLRSNLPQRAATASVRTRGPDSIVSARTQAESVFYTEDSEEGRASSSNTLRRSNHLVDRSEIPSTVPIDVIAAVREVLNQPSVATAPRSSMPVSRKTSVVGGSRYDLEERMKEVQDVQDDLPPLRDRLVTLTRDPSRNGTLKRSYDPTTLSRIGSFSSAR